MKLTPGPKFQNLMPESPKFLATALLVLFFVFFQNDFQRFFLSTHGQITTLTGGGNGVISSELTARTLNNRTLERIAQLIQEAGQNIQWTVAPNGQGGAGTSQLWAPGVWQGASPELLAFVGQVADGQAGRVSGVYVEGVLALPVIQQPEAEAAFVSTENQTITEFNSAARNGVTGLLAHNYLSGGLFYEIPVGAEVVIVYGDGLVRRYTVERIDEFQRLEPSNLRSRFIDLATGENLSSDQVFGRFYNGAHRVTFQTCLAKDGLSNWGLTFTVAQPVDMFPVAPAP